VVNDGDTYLEDASIRVRMPKINGLRIATRIYGKPDVGRFGLPRVSLYSLLGNYPTVKNYKDHIEVVETVGTLRHGIPERAFHEPLRIVFGRELVGQKSCWNALCVANSCEFLGARHSRLK
jgi:hypothetical protein